LVVGSGPGGLAAALSAARTGVKVTLVEKFGCFGGNITAVGVEGFAWYKHEKTIMVGVLSMSLKNVLKLWGSCTRKSINNNINFNLFHK
jgi:flavin-dependent dehydrogenase